MSLFLQVLINGILLGGIYGLVALGLNLIFGVMKVINFAQGAFLMLGMYSSYWIFQYSGLTPYTSFIISGALLFIIGVVVQRLILQSALTAPEHNQLLITFGLMLVIENLAMVLWTPDFKSIDFEGKSNIITIFNTNIHEPKLVVFIFTVILTIIFYAFLRYTYLGKAIRATANDLQGALLVGINVKKINMIAFGLGVALAGIGGALISTYITINPTVGSLFILKAFVVVVLGGLGNLFGALIGGIIIGITESFGGVFLPGSLKDLATFVIFIIVLLFKPTGIFGDES